MTFIKGQSGNPAGKEKGTLNKVTQDFKKCVNQLWNNNYPRLEKTFKNLPEEKQWDILQKLMSYAHPRMANVDASIDIQKLSDEQLDAVINTLSDGMNDE